MTTATFTVSGMTCGGCIRSVRTAIGEVEGVTDVDVHFKSGRVTVTSEQELDPAAVREAVADAGYEVTS